MEPHKQPPEHLWILGKYARDIHDIYVVDGGEELGHSLIGSVTTCIDKATQKVLACKCISKKKYRFARFVRNQIRVFHYLSGLPNIVRFEGGAFEDENSVWLVMELCSGGTLENYIAREGKVEPEGLAKRWFRELLKAVHWCHQMGVVHCDLHPRNVLLATDDTTGEFYVKLADFGASTIMLVNRETFRRQHMCGKPDDLRCLGFILYSMLTGTIQILWSNRKECVCFRPRQQTKPITERRLEIERAACKGQLVSCDESLVNVSDSALDLLTGLVARAERTTAQQTLEHPWIRKEGETTVLTVGFAFVARLREIRELSKMKRIALMVMAKNVPLASMECYKNRLRTMLIDEQARISIEELKIKLIVLGLNLDDSQVERLMDPHDCSYQDDMNKDFMESIAAMMPLDECESKDNIQLAFEYFDKNENEIIEREELELALTEYKFEDVTDAINDILDVKKGVMSFEEFTAVMTKRGADNPCMQRQCDHEILQ